MSAKDTHDPGWNDPPIFTYDKATAIQAAAANKKGTLLNKRVAFPISGGVQNSSTTSSQVLSDLGQPPLMTQPLLPPPLPSSSIPDLSSNITSHPPTSSPLNSATVTQDTIDVKNKLNEVLKNLNIDANCDDDIAKRIKIMEKMWEEDKLDDVVRLKIFELSEALAMGNACTADHIQKSLMVDYVSQCSSWMSGIRHLINSKKKCETQEK